MKTAACMTMIVAALAMIVSGPVAAQTKNTM
jgi:hypothetical protein